MASPELAVGYAKRAHPLSPRPLGSAHLDRLPNQAIEQRVEEVRLARKVVIEAHRFDAERRAELPHAELGEPLLFDELEGRPLDAFTVERSFSAPAALVRVSPFGSDGAFCPACRCAACHDDFSGHLTP